MNSVRLLYLAGGWFFSGLAFLGVLLPLLPTTPFLLLAGSCFARSSPRLHQRILNLPAFGEYLRQWDSSRTVPKAAKRKACLLIIASFSLSIYLVGSTAVGVFLAVLACVLLGCVALLPGAETDFATSVEGKQESARMTLDGAPALFPNRADEASACGVHQREADEPHIMAHSSERLSRLSER